MILTDIPVISSKDNSQLKRARAIRDGRERGMMFVEGTRLVSELIKSPVRADAIFVSEAQGEKCVGLLEQLEENRTVQVYMVSERAFDSITDTDNSQGIVVLARRPGNCELAETLVKNSLYVYLNKVNNPANLGAVIRTAEAAGAAAVITSPGSADAFAPKALRASMGSGFRLPVIADVALEEAIDLADQKGIRVVGADISGTRDYTEFDWKNGAMLVIGSEAHGLNSEELSRLGAIVMIPMENNVESLNLAVSTGILLFEAKRQRSVKG